MGKKLMLAIAMAALMATPSFAAVQNVKVGGKLATTSVLRSNFTVSNDRDRQNEILGQTYLNVGADLTDNVSTFISLFNERVWGGQTTSSNGTSVDIESAYVTMKEFLYSPLTLSIGRQPLAYGNQLIIGDGDSFSNVGTTSTTLGDLTGGVNFDAVKAVLSYDPLTVDLFAARVSNTTALTMNTTTARDNVNLFGINANYKLSDKMNTVVEAYTFAKIDDSNKDFGVNQQDKGSQTYVPGLRVSTNPIEGLSVQLEGAYQLGQFWNSTDSTMQSRSGAYAIQGIVNYALPVCKEWKPVLGASYTFLSGNRTAGSKGDWDSMYENQNTGRIFDALGLASTNSQLATLSYEMTPIKDLTTKLSVNGLWLAEKAAYVAGSTSSSKYLGTEADLDLTYAYTEDVKFGVSAGYFLTGKAYVNPSNKNASQVLSSVSVAF